MFIDKKQKALLDALNQRKYLKFNSGTYVGEIEVKAVDSRMTTLTCRGEKFAEIVYQNDFLVDATSNETNFLIEELVTYNTIAPTPSYKRFLNDVIEVNSFPLPQLRETNLNTRRIGLGVMGWADALVRMGLPYDSEKALDPQKAEASKPAPRLWSTL